MNGRGMKVKISEQAAQAQEAEDAPKVLVIDRSEAQLTFEEQIEINEVCGDMRDSVNALALQARGAARHIERPNNMLKRAALESYLRQAETAIANAKRALTRLSFAAVVLACLALAGCGSSDSRDEGQRGSAVSTPGHTCENGQCWKNQ